MNRLTENQKNKWMSFDNHAISYNWISFDVEQKLNRPKLEF